MTFSDFGLGILASYLANKADKVIAFVFGDDPKKQPAPKELAQDNQDTKPLEPRFKTFDAWTDLPEFLEMVSSPAVSVLIEDDPSTFYNLPCLVLESNDTGEWYAFSRGRMSFQGTGGGMNNSRDIIGQLREKYTPIGVWVVERSLLDAFENGRILWAEVKPRAVPLLAFLARESSWSEIQGNAKKLLQNAQQ